jgi:FHA domain
MSDKGDAASSNGAGARAGKLFGSLRQALAAANHEDRGNLVAAGHTSTVPALREIDERVGDHADLDAAIALAEEPLPIAERQANAIAANEVAAALPPPLPSAHEAARQARGGTPNVPPVDRHVEFETPPTTQVVRPVAAERVEEDNEEMTRTKLVRGKQKVERGAFLQDPVVAWLVIVGGPGIGDYRPVFEGNNTIGRAGTNRIPIDFGDDSISAEEQAYIRYDSTDRSFLFVPNLAKTNVVSVNDKRPAAPVVLQSMDVILMGRTQLVFVPFCGPEFDWAALSEQNGQ